MPDQMTSDGRVMHALQELAAACRDGEDGYRGAAEATADPNLKLMLDQLARQRAQEADALDRLIREQGGQTGGRTADIDGYAHRLFASLRAALTNDDRAGALSEVARGESYVEAAFDRAKRLDLQGRERAIVQRLHETVKQSRDRVRRLVELEDDWTAGVSQRLQDPIKRSRFSIYQLDNAGWAVRTGRRSVETVGRYIGDNPMTSTAIALGLGFVLGALTRMIDPRDR
jgi:uncharacterized protein (TIGR02284 family)